jgi:hypothetical protein
VQLHRTAQLQMELDALKREVLKLSSQVA